MMTLSQRLDHYLAVRRSLGFDLAFAERVLRTFTRYADHAGQHYISTDLFLAWKKDYGSANTNTWAVRLGMVRSFAIWLASHDEKTEVPPSGLVTGRFVRPRPFIYSRGDIERLVAAAGRLPSAYGLRALLWQTLFGLIAVTGLRVNEALHLDQSDVDLERGLLSIRRTKNGRDRVIPIWPCTMERLANYADERDRLVGPSPGPFFMKEDGKPAGDCGARYNFAQVSQNIGMRSPERYQRHGVGPRIHDLRHSFAVHTILDWFREGRDIDREMYRLFKYVSINEPQLLLHCQKVLAMPSKRHEKRVVDFLARDEMDALLAAPDPTTWFGRRDRTLLLLMLQTGLRVSEAVGLKRGDVELGTGAHVRCYGKGRKERATPLRTDSRSALRDWMAVAKATSDDPLFSTTRGRPLSRDAVARVLHKYVALASRKAPTLASKRVTPHVLRHTAAMQLLQSGVDRTVIALWLGHESVETTQMYIHADIELKERAMARTRSVNQPAGRFQPDDELLAFLESL